MPSLKIASPDLDISTRNNAIALPDDSILPR